MKIFSKYSLEARVFPSLVGLAPFYLWQYFYLGNLFSFDKLAVKIIGDVSVSAIVLYVVAEFFVRYPSKLLEDKIFNNKLDFPTTKFMLFSDNEYSKNAKVKIREKLKRDFSLELLDERAELEDDKEARGRIKDAVGLIISVVKDGYLVLRQNIAYGFVRNLWSASILGIFFSIVLMISSFNNNPRLYNTGSVFLVCYTLYVLWGTGVIKYFGKNYARKLIEEYLSGSYEK